MSQTRNSFQHKMRVFRRLIIILVILVVCGFGLVLLGQMEDTVEGRGTVRGLREYELKSQIQSRIAQIYFHSGETVKKGTLLLELDDRKLEEERLTLANSIRELEAEINAKTWALAVLRHDPLPKEYRHTRIALDEYKEREIKSRADVETFKLLHERKVVSMMELQKKELEYLKNQAERKKLEEDFIKLESGMADNIIKQAEAEIELLKQRLASRRKELASLSRHEEDYKIRAPEDGVIGYIPTRTGTYVEPGQLLAIVSVSGGRKFIAYIDEKSIHKVREGQLARIESSQYNYFEYGYFNGKVYAVDELPEPRGNRNCYAVRILLDDGNPKPLRIGSTGNAEIVVGRDFIFRVMTGLR